MKDTLNEVWMPVPFEGFRRVYEVSRQGIIRRIDNKEIRRTYVHKSGYVRVVLSYEGKQMNISLHRLVALTFLPNPNPDEFNQVGHWDDDKMNNSVENLYWTNARENNSHGMRISKAIATTGKKRQSRQMRQRGKKRPVFKLVPTSISGATASWYCSIAEAGRENGLTPSDIRAACRGIRDSAGGYRWCFAYDEGSIRALME